MKRETIERLFKQHYAKMQRVARTLLYDEQESEDVVSDIFESLLNGQTVLLPDTEERYLLTAVRNRCLKRLRHEAVKRAVDYEVSTEVEDDRLTDIVFHLRFTDGYRYEEIAVAEGISRVAVWKHLSHVITEIKRQFNPRKL